MQVRSGRWLIKLQETTKNVAVDFAVTSRAVSICQLEKQCKERSHARRRIGAIIAASNFILKH